MTYPRLKVEDFGRALIESGDLDPVYIALRRVERPEEWHKRWLVAYWLFYHPGAACYMAEATEARLFWNRVGNATRNVTPSPLGERWPRASERRHFRGEKAEKAVGQLMRDFPEGYDLVDQLEAAAANGYRALYNRVCALPQFGPWMAFKVADMLERCLDVSVDFDLASVTMFDDPKKAALMVARERLGLAPETRFKDPDATIRAVAEHLIREFKDLSAPPSHNRPIGYQEVETVLCKAKAHANGHYPVGKDIKEIREGLEAWATVSPSAKEFLWAMPPLVSAEFTASYASSPAGATSVRP